MPDRFEPVVFRALHPAAVAAIGIGTAILAIWMLAAGVYAGAAVIVPFGAFMALWDHRSYVALGADGVEVVNLSSSFYAYADIVRAEATNRRYLVTQLHLRDGRTVTIGSSVGFAEALADAINERRRR